MNSLTSFLPAKRHVRRVRRVAPLAPPAPPTPPATVLVVSAVTESFGTCKFTFDQAVVSTAGIVAAAFEVDFGAGFVPADSLLDSGADFVTMSWTSDALLKPWRIVIAPGIVFAGPATLAIPQSGTVSF